MQSVHMEVLPSQRKACQGNKDTETQYSMSSFPSTHFSKGLPYFHCIFLPPLLQITDPNCMGFLLGFLSYSTEPYTSASVPVPYCFDYHSFVVQSEFREHDSPSSPFPFSRLFWLFQVFCVSKEIAKFFCSRSKKNAISNLTVIVLNLPWVVWSF